MYEYKYTKMKNIYIFTVILSVYNTNQRTVNIFYLSMEYLVVKDKKYVCIKLVGWVFFICHA